MKFRLKLYAILSIGTLLLSTQCLAQNSSTFRLWGDFNYTGYRSANFGIGADAGVRTNLSSSGQWHAYLNPEVTYRINEIYKLKANLGVFKTWNKSGVNSLEFRISQEVNATWPQLPKILFKNRLKLEERYFTYRSSEQNVSVPPSNWAYRLRYRLIPQSDYFNLSENIKNVFVFGLVEFFIPIQDIGDEAFSNRNRLGLGFGQLVPKGQRYEVQLIRQATLTDADTNSRNIQWVIRLRYYLKTNNFK